MQTAVPSYTVTVTSGLREGYDGFVHNDTEAVEVCRQYCDEAGYCFAVTPTTFTYKGGSEPGVLVTLINYPRFPQSPQQILMHACEIAGRLKATFRQNRVCVVAPDKTVMVGQP